MGMGVCTMLIGEFSGRLSSYRYRYRKDGKMSVAADFLHVIKEKNTITLLDSKQM